MPLMPEQRLAITLRYLATGDQQQSVAWAFRVGKSTVSEVVKEVCDVLWETLAPIYLKPPEEHEWSNIAKNFSDAWNFPNCVGALDGKHVIIQAPKKTGSQFFNYKKSFSLVLMATCDSNYNFTLVDVGQYGSASDGGVFASSAFGQAFKNGELKLPKGVAKLPGSDQALPCFLVGDEAFPLSENLMRPYPGNNLTLQQRVFNYRLSRARRTIENAFGILVARWRIFRRPIIAAKETVDKIVLAAVCLHNFIKKHEATLAPTDHIYCPPNFVDQNGNDGLWHQEVAQAISTIGRTGSNRAAQAAYKIRDTLATYFMTPEGQVPWQL